MSLGMPILRMMVTPIIVACINKAYFFLTPKHKFKVKWEIIFEWTASEILMSLDMPLFKPTISVNSKSNVKGFF
jgi:hypothetical protein